MLKSTQIHKNGRHVEFPMEECLPKYELCNIVQKSNFKIINLRFKLN